MYIYHALIITLSAHMIHINLNMIFYTHVEHSPTKTIYIKYYTNIYTYTPKAWQIWTKMDPARFSHWQMTGSYTKYQRTPRRKPKQCNSNRIVYPSGVTTPDLLSIETIGTHTAVHAWQQSNRQTSASSHIGWSCGWTNKSSEIPWDPLWPKNDLQKSMWKQQHWSGRNVCQSRKLWLQRVLNKATSSYFL